MKALKNYTPYSLRIVGNVYQATVGYRLKMSVKEVMVLPSSYGKTAYYICPRCHITMEREFMAFCDRCGQHLDWSAYTNAKVIYPG